MRSLIHRIVPQLLTLLGSASLALALTTNAPWAY